MTGSYSPPRRFAGSSSRRSRCRQSGPLSWNLESSCPQTARARILPPGCVRFLFLGSLMPHKGVGDLTAVFTHPDLLNRDYELRICGSGNPQVVESLLAANPRVRYLGEYTQEQLPELLREADVGLSPSWFETFHRVTREYLAAGLPVIGSDAFGIPDAV